MNDLFEAIVAEDGAVVYFPHRDRTTLPFGHLTPEILRRLSLLSIPLEQATLDKHFEERGVMGSFRHVPLDESSAAYKDVDEVIKAVITPGVATVVNRLRPVLVLKGE